MMKWSLLFNRLGLAIRWLVPRIAVVAVATVGVHGVYELAKLFMSEVWARLVAGSLEATYIGLALYPVPPQHVKYARNVSYTAVGTAIAQVGANSFMHLSATQPQMAVVWQVLLSILHAVPMPILGFMMSNLVLHPDGGYVTMASHKREQSPETLYNPLSRLSNFMSSSAKMTAYPSPQRIEPKKSSKTTTTPQNSPHKPLTGGRNSEYSPDDILQLITDGVTKRKDLLVAFGGSSATLDRRLDELIDGGFIVKSGRGAYSII